MIRWYLQPILPVMIACCCIAKPVFAADFIDLKQQVPESLDVCAAVKTLRDSGREAEIAAHALPETDAPSVSDPRKFMTQTAWAEASTGQPAITNYLTYFGYPTDFSVARVPLTASGPQAWILSTSVGSLRNPLFWVFTSTPDGSKPAHMVAQIGEEASGHFETYFVRFNNKPYAIEAFNGERGTYLDVTELGSSKTICSFSPP